MMVTATLPPFLPTLSLHLFPLRPAHAGKLSSSRRLLAGLGAGVTEAILIVTPFDVVKVRLQAQHGMDKANLKYQGPLDAARKIISQEGMGALWSGVTPTIYRNGIQQATMFFLKTWIDDNVLGVQKSLTKDGQETRQPQIWQSMASGFMASCPGLVMTNPLDIVKVRASGKRSSKTATQERGKGWEARRGACT